VGKVLQKARLIEVGEAVYLELRGSQGVAVSERCVMRWGGAVVEGK
jgi:hypothetical protein